MESKREQQDLEKNNEIYERITRFESEPRDLWEKMISKKEQDLQR